MVSPSSAGASSGLRLEEDIVARATPFCLLPDTSLVTCSAEDLVVLKSFADRPQDRVDVEGIVRRQQGKLDWPAIEERLAPLVELKEEPEILLRLRALRASLGPPP